MQHVANSTCDHGRMAPEQAFGAFGNGVEHRLYVGWGTGDDVENSRRRGLAFQRFLRLVEQPHILDRDHGLVGKGLQQLGVVRRKRAGLCARDREQPDRDAGAHHGHPQHAAEAVLARDFHNRCVR